MGILDSNFKSIDIEAEMRENNKLLKLLNYLEVIFVVVVIVHRSDVWSELANYLGIALFASSYHFYPHFDDGLCGRALEFDVN